MVFSNRFLRRVERRSINHLYWYSDAIDPVVVVSSYFTLHFYFRNVDCCELFELFRKDSIQSQMQNREMEIGYVYWYKSIAAPIIPSCRSWLLKIISLSFAVKSKFWIHALLVSAISGGDLLEEFL